MKKVVSLLLAMVMALGVLCTAVAEAEKPTITILMNVESSILDIETNAYTKHLEEQFNCNLDFVHLPASGAGDKLSMMINSGETLPYVINYRLNLETTWQYAQTGAIRPLTEYYSNPEFNSNLVEAEKKVPGIFKYITCPDGEIYAIPEYQRELHSNVQNKLWINQTWIDETGMGTPKTTDEFYEVMKKVQENHPESLGLIGRAGSGQADLVEYFMNAFIYDDGDDHFTIKDGVLDVAYDKDAWKECLTYLRKLYQEGIIYKDSFILERSTQKALALQEDPLICAGFFNSSISLIDQSNTAWKNYEGLEPLTGPEGVSYARLNGSYAQSHWLVTKDCPEDLVDLAVSIGIFMFDPTEEEFILNRFGIEGVDWSRPDPSEPSKYEGFPARYYQLHVIWNMEQNSHWQKDAPIFALDVDQGEWDDGDATNWSHKVPHAVVKYMEHLPKAGEYVPRLIYNEDELDEFNEIRTNLQTYVDECKTLFITGGMSLEDDWDDYLNTLESMNYKGFIECAQGVYDRMYK